MLYKSFLTSAILFVFIHSVDCSLYLDGTGYYEPPTVALDSDGVTIEFWARKDRITDSEQNILCLGAPQDDKLCVIIDNRFWKISMSNGTVLSHLTYHRAPESFTWTHVGFAVTAQSYLLTINGDAVYKGEIEKGVLSGNWTIRIGACFLDHQYMQGAIDMVRTWSIALNASDIKKNMLRGSLKDPLLTLSEIFPKPSCTATLRTLWPYLKKDSSDPKVIFQGSAPLSAAKAWFTFDEGMETKNTILPSIFFPSCVLSPPPSDLKNLTTMAVSPWVAGLGNTTAFSPKPNPGLPAPQFALSLPGDTTKNRISFQNFVMPAEWSLEFWMNPASTERGWIVSSATTSFQYNRLSIWYTANAITETFDLDNRIPINTWSHFAFQYSATNKSNGTMRFLMNGVEMETKSAIKPFETADIEIGTQPASDKFAFNGKLDELKVYNYRRSPQEIATSMGQRLLPPYSSTLVHYINFNEGVGRVLNDVAAKTTGSVTGPDNTTRFTSDQPIATPTFTQYALTCAGNNYVPDANFVLLFSLRFPPNVSVSDGIIVSRLESGNGFVIRNDIRRRILVDLFLDGTVTTITSNDSALLDTWTQVSLVSAADCPTFPLTRLMFNNTEVGRVSAAPGKLAMLRTPLVIGTTTAGQEGFPGTIEDFIYSTLQGSSFEITEDATPAPLRPTLPPAPVKSIVPTVFGLTGCPQKSPTSNFIAACRLLNPQQQSITIFGMNLGTYSCDNTTSGASCIVFVNEKKVPAPFCTDTKWTDTRVICPPGSFFYPASIPLDARFTLMLQTWNGTARQAQVISVRNDVEVPVVRSLQGCTQSDETGKRAMGCYTGTSLTITGSLFAQSNSTSGAALLNNVTFKTLRGDPNVSQILSCVVTRSSYTEIECQLFGIEQALAVYDAPYVVVVTVGAKASINTEVTISPELGVPTVYSAVGCESNIGKKFVMGCETGSIITLSGANFGTLPEYADPTMHFVTFRPVGETYGVPLCQITHWSVEEILCEISLGNPGETRSTGEWVVGVISYGQLSPLYTDGVYIASKINPLCRPVIQGIIPSTFTASDGNARDAAGTLGTSRAWVGQGKASWVQVDLQQEYKIYRVASSSMQGLATLSYRLQYSVDPQGKNFTEIAGTFSRGRDEYTDVNALRPPIRARFVRFVAETFEGKPSLSIEVFAAVSKASCAEWKSEDPTAKDGIYIVVAPQPVQVMCRMDFFDHSWTLFHSQPWSSSALGVTNYAVVGVPSRLRDATVSAMALASSSILIGNSVPSVLWESTLVTTNLDRGRYILSVNGSAIQQMQKGECLSRGLNLTDWIGTRANTNYLTVDPPRCDRAVRLFECQDKLTIRYDNFSLWGKADMAQRGFELYVGAPIRFPARVFRVRFSINIEELDVELFRASLNDVLLFRKQKMVVILSLYQETEAYGATVGVFGISTQSDSPDAAIQLLIASAKDENAAAPLRMLGMVSLQLMSSMTDMSGTTYMIAQESTKELKWTLWLIIVAGVVLLSCIAGICLKTKCCGRWRRGAAPHISSQELADGTYAPREMGDVPPGLGNVTSSSLSASTSAPTPQPTPQPIPASIPEVKAATPAVAAPTPAAEVKKPTFPRRIRDAPVPVPWQCFEVETGEKYYYNPVSKATTWDAPTA